MILNFQVGPVMDSCGLAPMEQIGHGVAESLKV